jgi:transglutaminase-like putative cysteine protease
LSTVVGALAAEVGAQAPAYRLEYLPVRQVECTLSGSTRIPGMSVKEWVFFHLHPPQTPRQHIALSLEPDGREGWAGGPVSRPLVFFRRVNPQPVPDAECTYRLVFRGTISETLLVPLKEGARPSRTPALTPRERKLYTERTDLLDFDSPAVRAWLDQADLHRRPGERDLDFARRVFLSMRTTFRYGPTPARSARASEVARDRKAVCVGLSSAYAAALRANAIPARELSVKIVAENANVGGTELGHSTNEFFAEGIGWVPADLTGCVTNFGNEAEALSYFAHDRGDHLIVATDDPTVVVDTVRFGSKEPLPPADFRASFQTRVPDRKQGLSWGLEVTGSGTGKWEHQDRWTVRQCTDPSAYERCEPQGKPQPAALPAILVWSDESGWHLRTLSDGKPHHFQMKVMAEYDLAAGERAAGTGADGKDKPLVAAGYQRATEGHADFQCPAQASALRFSLSIDRQKNPEQVWIGRKSLHPRRSPFTLAAKPRHAP